MSNQDWWTPEWRAHKAELVRNMSREDKRGGIYGSTSQRTIVVTFDTPEEAEAWDALPEDAAFAVLAAAAAIRAEEEDDELG